MSKMLPRLLTLRRRELHEKREQLSSLIGLREELGKQVRQIDSVSDDAPGGARGGNGPPLGEIHSRRERLGASLSQVEAQIKAARQEIEGHLRALRMLEANKARSTSKRPVSAVRAVRAAST